MKNAIARLAYTRSIVAEYKAEVAAAQAKLETSGVWQYLEQQQGYLKTAEADVADAEVDARKAALKAFAETGNKTPHPAIKVKIYTVLDYDDGEALGYARFHLQGAVRLNKQKFEKAAKILELDFVTIFQEPRVTIARDLSKYLSGDQ